MTSTRIEDSSTESRSCSLEGSPYPSRRMPRLSAGSTLGSGRFEIRGPLGAGGMGVVYEAYDRLARHRVALKTGHLLHPEVIYRLKGEFRSLRGVTHPNLVRILELFAEDELWYFTMELVEGVELGAWLACQERTEHELRHQFAQLASGVHAIHDSGKVHRDLKPSNVFVSPEGRLVILDYGLVADAVAGGVGQTHVDGRISGTPAYLAPEQAYGGAASQAGDWYAFGVMLHQALTGELPFPRPRAWAKVDGVPAPAGGEPRSAVSPELIELCQRLLATDPAKRPGFSEIAATLGGSFVNASTQPSAQASAQPQAQPGNGTSMLERALRATRGGNMRVLVVSDGSRRARVATQLQELEHRGAALVLRGCHRRDESIPFNGLDDVVDDLSHHLAKLPRERAAALLPRDVTTLAHMFPVLNRVDVVAEFPARLAFSGDPTSRSYAALSELLSRLSDRQPVVLWLDGLENADAETLALAKAMLEGEALPVLVVLASDQSSPKLRTLLRAIQRCPWAKLEPASGPLVRRVSLRAQGAHEARCSAA